MSSPVNWALLGLVIERPSYGYELAQRFERIYGEVLPVSSASHIYAALNALEARAMVEKVPESVAAQSAGRQPKPHYRATEQGHLAYRERLVAQMREDRRRSGLFVHQLAVFASDPQTALQIIERYEQVCLEEAAKAPTASAHGSQADADRDLVERLLCEENRVAVGAALSWVEYARREFNSLAEAGTPRR